MFLKVFLRPLTLRIYAISYGLTFILSLFYRNSFLKSLWISFVCSFVFCGLWAFVLYLISTLLSPYEMNSYFPQKKGSDPHDYNDDKETDEALTLDELYQYPENENSLTSNDTEPTKTITEDKIIQNDNMDDPGTPSYDIPPAQTPSPFDRTDKELKLGSDGNFDFTVAGKTLKVSPEDGAQAIKKVLYNDIDIT